MSNLVKVFVLDENSDCICRSLANGVFHSFQTHPDAERSGASKRGVRGLYLSIYLSLPRLPHGFSSSLVKASQTVFDDMITPPKTHRVFFDLSIPINRWDNRWDNPWVFFSHQT